MSNGDEMMIGCTLQPREIDSRLAQWEQARIEATGSEAITDGAQMRFPAEAQEWIVQLAAAESQCCGFLTISTDVTPTEVVLRITSSAPDAQAVIQVLTGVERP